MATKVTATNAGFDVGFWLFFEITKYPNNEITPSAEITNRKIQIANPLAGGQVSSNAQIQMAENPTPKAQHLFALYSSLSSHY